MGRNRRPTGVGPQVKLVALPRRLNGRRRALGGLPALLIALSVLLAAAQPSAAQDCSFQLGFKAIRDLIPEVVGECLDNERHDPVAGLTRQATAAGELIWRKADNWTGFSDGRRTWVNGPEGLQQRFNNELFPWEPPVSGRLLRRLTPDQLLNAEYRLPLLGSEDTPVRLRDGQAAVSSEHEPGVTEYAGILGDTAAFGDLDGDGYADAAVAAFTSGGGSGTFIHLLAVLDRDGKPVQAARAYLGDRVRVERLVAAGGEIAASTLAHRPDEGLCCPSLKVSRFFILSGDRLLARQVLAIEIPHTGELVSSGVLVRGNASVAPDSGSFNYLVHDARGGVIGAGRVPAAAGSAAGAPTTFAAPIEFLAARNEPGRIEIIDAARTRTSVAVMLRAAPLSGGRAAREPLSELVLESPAGGAAVIGALELRGRIDSMPFEKNLTYRVYDLTGAVVAEGYISVEGEYGGSGAFAKSIDLRGIGRPGVLRVEVRNESPVDGALIASASVEVYFAGA